MALIPIAGTNVSLEVYQNNLLGTLVMARAHVNGVLKPGFIQIQDNSSGINEQMYDAFVYSGKFFADNAAMLAWIAVTPRAQVKQLLLKWVREKLIPALTAFINSAIGGTQPTPTVGDVYSGPLSIFEDIVRSITFTVGADGKVSGSI